MALAVSASAFLTEWVRSYLDAGPRGLGSVSAAVDECLAVGSTDGYTRGELETAAGGHLSGYIRASIIKRAW
jgi:hypothetical protein